MDMGNKWFYLMCIAVVAMFGVAIVAGEISKTVIALNGC